MVPSFNQSVVKPRRSRKDRARGGANSKSGTTSSSGINVGGATTISSSLYDYNSNQLTAQYGNANGSNQQAQLNASNYAEDLELGMGGTNTFSINNLSD